MSLTLPHVLRVIRRSRTGATGLLLGLVLGLVLALQAGCAAEGAGSAGSEATPSMASRTTERAGPATSSNRSNPGNSGAGDSSPRTDLVTALDETDASKRSRIRLELASAYFSQGQTSTALDEVKRALSADPSSVPAYNLRGLIYATLGETILADDSFRRALALQPNEPDVLHNQGWYLCNQKRFADARIAFNTALAQLQYRDRAKTFLAQGVCEARGGDMNAAEKALLRSFELDAGNPATSINLSEVLLKKGDLDRARFYVQRINNMPQYANAETLWLAARIEHKRGNADAVDDLGAQLRARYPGTRQTSAFEQGQFNE